MVPGGWWARMLAKYGLGRIVVWILVGSCCLFIFGWGLFGMTKTAYYRWSAENWKEKAQEARDEAVAQTKNYQASDGAFANATQTRENMTTAVGAAAYDFDAAIRRIDDYEKRTPAAPGANAAPDPDLLRDVDAAEDRYRAAQDRLQRARASRTRAKTTD